MVQDYILSMNSVTKRYPGVLALDKVTFKVARGTVHALIGENGAGKSTLMNILAGATPLDDGEIYLDNEKVEFSSPESAINQGIAMIYQELNLVEELSVAENIFLGLNAFNSIIFKKEKLVKKADELLLKYGINLKAGEIVKNLSIAKKQQVEIAKALSKNAKILIMDEPTSSLSLNDAQHLFKLIKNFKNQGVSIIYITHRIDEVFTICDNVTVLCDGKKINDWQLSEVNENLLISAMVGREITQLFPKEHFPLGDLILKVENLTKQNMYEDISFEVRAGEILGMAGLVGAGRTEICLSIFGALTYDSGRVEIKGQEIINRHPADGMKQGIAYVSEDRKLKGLNLKSSIKNNISITNEEEVSRFGIIRNELENGFVDSLIDRLRIKCQSREQGVIGLSGGNQQKVVLAKWISRNLDVLILDEPTRGVDVGAKEELHKIIVELARNGLAIILISSELPEVLGMSDRILVIYEGKNAGIINAADANQEIVMMMASGRKVTNRINENKS